MRHEAIYATHPNVVFISDHDGAYDEEGSKVVIDEGKIAEEVKRLQADYDAKKYQRDRIYPNIGDQLDMIYWDKVHGTEKWKETIDAVKQAHPKPE